MKSLAETMTLMPTVANSTSTGYSARITRSVPAAALVKKAGATISAPIAAR